ncbi:MAG: hypothetical protein LC642_06385 [Verrucomicrobiaceae bacterium]|nr:hypothetical protein [Verrucomicrobiaceae bacterium]
MKSGDNDDIQPSAVEDHDGILTIRGGGARRDWNGIHYKQGMSAKNVGTTKLSANIATIPPGGVAYAHIHVGFELILYILEGRVRHESPSSRAPPRKSGTILFPTTAIDLIKRRPHSLFRESAV